MIKTRRSTHKVFIITGIQCHAHVEKLVRRFRVVAGVKVPKNEHRPYRYLLARYITCRDFSLVVAIRVHIQTI